MRIATPSPDALRAPKPLPPPRFFAGVSTCCFYAEFHLPGPSIPPIYPLYVVWILPLRRRVFRPRRGPVFRAPGGSRCDGGLPRCRPAGSCARSRVVGTGGGRKRACEQRGRVGLRHEPASDPSIVVHRQLAGIP